VVHAFRILGHGHQVEIPEHPLFGLVDAVLDGRARFFHPGILEVEHEVTVPHFVSRRLSFDEGQVALLDFTDGRFHVVRHGNLHGVTAAHHGGHVV